MYRAMQWVTILCCICIGSLTATWSPPVDLPQAGQNARAPQIVLDTNGNATAVWYTIVGGNSIIQASTNLLGGNWQDAVNLSLLGQQVGDPQIAVDASGNVTVVWWRREGSNYILQASTKLFGENWQDAADFAQAGQGAGLPQIAVDPKGNATAVWYYTSSGGEIIIRASTKLFGGNWQAAVDLSLSSQSSTEPQIAVDAGGNATAIWQMYDGSNWTIQASTKLFGGSWQEAVNLSLLGTTAENPQIAVDPYGNATAIWQMYDGGNWTIQASTKLFGGSWQDAVALSETGYISKDPQIAVDMNGNATAVWYRYDGSNYIIQASTKPFGNTWQATVDLSQAADFVPTPQIAVGASGDATAIWRYNSTIQTSTKPFGGSWQDPVNVSEAGQNALVPQVAVDPYSNITAVWIRRDGSAYIPQAASNFFGPTVIKLIPTSGSAAGGNSITITGTNFLGVTSVLFGETPASFTVVSPTTITVTVPPGTGVVNVRIIASSETSPIVPAGQYTYQPTAPTHFKGKGKHGKKKLLLKTKWGRNTSSSISRYEIFARDQRIELISATRKPKSTIHLNPHHQYHLTKKYRQYLHNKYKIRAVDSFGTPSPFTHIKVKH